MDSRPDVTHPRTRDQQPTEMSRSHVSHCRLVSALGRLVLVLTLAVFAGVGFAEQVAALTPPTGTVDETNTQDTLRAYLQLQEQIHATQLAIERNRKEADAATAENTKALASRLQGIEQSLSLQRTQELEAMQYSNRVKLVVAALIAGLGFVAMFLMGYFQWRTIDRLAEISAALPVAHALGAGAHMAALGAGEKPLVSTGPAEQSNQRLLGALERLESRIHQLEQATHPPLHEGNMLGQAAAAVSFSPNGGTNGAAVGPNPAEPAATPEDVRIMMLLGKGQSFLNLDQAEEALGCFDQALEIKADHAEALVKRGTALERLNKLDEAIACYDRAIAADTSLTVAYLYKGGLFNRMERFDEALECYEQALRTQESRRG